MVDHEILQTVKQLEVELHQLATRRNSSRMQTLLHDDFEEFGRSGRRYTRREVLNEFASEDAVLPVVHAESIEVIQLAERVALVTYVSAHVDDSGMAHRHTLRSSVWVYSRHGWQMRFHQGTPMPDRTGT